MTGIDCHRFKRSKDFLLAHKTGLTMRAITLCAPFIDCITSAMSHCITFGVILVINFSIAQYENIVAPVLRGMELKNVGVGANDYS